MTFLNNNYFIKPSKIKITQQPHGIFQVLHFDAMGRLDNPITYISALNQPLEIPAITLFQENGLLVGGSFYKEGEKVEDINQQFNPHSFTLNIAGHIETAYFARTGRAYNSRQISKLNARNFGLTLRDIVNTAGFKHQNQIIQNIFNCNIL